MTTAQGERPEELRGFPSPPANDESASTPRQIQVPILPANVTSLIDSVASVVARLGNSFEDEIIRREKGNEYFAFLTADWRDPQRVYYYWRVYSLLQGDTLLKWRAEPFQVVDHPSAVTYVPPPPVPQGSYFESHLYTGASSSPPPRTLDVIVAVVAGDHGLLYHALPPALRAGWKSRLRKVTTQKRTVGIPMSFAIKHHEYCLDLIVLLTESMCQFPPSPSKTTSTSSTNTIGGSGGGGGLLTAAPETNGFTENMSAAVTLSMSSGLRSPYPEVRVKHVLGHLFVIADILGNVCEVSNTLSGSMSSTMMTLKAARCFIKAMEVCLLHILGAVFVNLLFFAPAPKSSTKVMQNEKEHEEVKMLTFEFENGSPGQQLLQWTRFLVDLWELKRHLPLHVLQAARASYPFLLPPPPAKYGAVQF
jgi:hypothetical protein